MVNFADTLFLSTNDRHKLYPNRPATSDAKSGVAFPGLRTIEEIGADTVIDKINSDHAEFSAAADPRLWTHYWHGGPALPQLL